MGWQVFGSAQLRSELAREYARYELVQRQIRELESRRRARLKSPGTAAERQVVQLMELGAIGPSSAWLLVMEFFGWRAFSQPTRGRGIGGFTKIGNKLMVGIAL